MFFDFKQGDIVDAYGDIAVIIDVLRSEKTDNLSIYVRFIRNIGDSRPFDVLTISASSPRGTDSWKLATVQQLQERITAREEYIKREIEQLMILTKSKKDME